MSEPTNHPQYGLWASPLSAKSVSLGQRLSEAQWDTDGATLVWLEGRGDRGVLVAADLNGSALRDLTEEHSVRARVGYGGGDFHVAHGNVYFASGGKLYRKSLAPGAVKAITPALGQPAAPVTSPCGKFVLYVFSMDRKDGLAVVDSNGNAWPKKVAEGRDFYMQPRWGKAGTLAAWVCWDHPNMPWDGTELMLANVRLGNDELPHFEKPVRVAGSKDFAVTQPEFSPDGKFLSFLDDRSGWFDLYLYDIEAKSERKILDAGGAQLGGPAWVQGVRYYGWTPDSKGIVFTRNERGFSSLHVLEIESGKTRPLFASDEYTDFVLPAVNPSRSLVAVIASSGVRTPRIVVKNLADVAREPARVMKRATGENVDQSGLVAPRPVSWRDVEGAEIHGLLYSVRRPELAGLPPAIVHVHGGPTGQTKAAYAADIQFLATRGYAVLSVNYRGSTGYGRDYMNALRGNWGIHDVNDSLSAAKFLADSGEADPARLIIMGGSAGGFTVLQTMVDHPGKFKVGVNLFGVSNQFGLAMETHKFEERYTDSLIGPLPEASALYRERSPQFHAEKIVDPLIIFQGEIDEVVPKNQSDVIAASLKERGIPHEYHVFLGEGHGWRKVETIEAYVTALEKFLKLHVLFG